MRNTNLAEKLSLTRVDSLTVYKYPLPMPEIWKSTMHTDSSGVAIWLYKTLLLSVDLGQKSTRPTF